MADIREVGPRAGWDVAERSGACVARGGSAGVGETVEGLAVTKVATSSKIPMRDRAIR